MVQNLRPTSKAALKQMCLYTANGDLEKAQKIYDYMIKDMEELPLFDAPQLSTMQQLKSGMAETWAWVSQNQEQIMNWVDIISSIFKGRGGGTPPSAASASVNPIPSINQ